MGSESDQFVNIVRQLVRELCPTILQAFRADTRAPITKTDGSLVTETDFLVERRFIRALTETFPKIALLGEEMSASASAIAKGNASGYYASVMASAHQIIIDPIDGTRNFVEGKSPFCIAAALTKRVDDGIWPEASVVAIPLEGVMYWCDETGVFQERIDSGEVVPVQRLAIPDARMSVSSKDRDWLASHGYTMKYRWLSSGASVHDFIGTALGRISASVVGHQRVWDLMAPLAIAERLGCVLRDIESGEIVSAVSVEALSPDLEQRPWGLTQKMIMLPLGFSVSEFLSAST